MQKYKSIAKISEYLDQEVMIGGWVHNLRSSGKLMFLQVRDGSGFIQAIVSKNDVGEQLWEQAQTIAQEASVVLTGTVVKHPKKDEYELKVRDVKVLQTSPEYPIANKEHGVDFLMENRHLWLRSQRQWAVQRVRNTVINAIYNFLNTQGFIKIDSPILTPNACEGTTTLFEVPYFDLGNVFLSQTGQLYLEAAMMAHGKVFDFGPVFRAEKSKTRRHLTEFWMMDAEMAFHDYEDNMNVQEALLKHIAAAVLEQNQQELKILERDQSVLTTIVNEPFKRMTHKEAVEYLQSKGSDITHEDDLGADDETALTAEFGVPVFVHTWPAKIKAFYMKRAQDPEYVLGSDLIATDGYGEVSGGAEREENYDVLLEHIKEEGLNQEDFEWYLDLRKYGSVPHSGFGMGLERIVAWMTGVQHIRETIPFARTIYRVRP